MKYLKKFNTTMSMGDWAESSIANYRLSPYTFLCEDNGQVYYKEYVVMVDNGYDYIDLGLPSGSLWATCNIGANSPEQFGGYYAWGETYTKNSYTPKTYNYYYDENTYWKYCEVDKKRRLDLSDDIAYIEWGGGWHIPTIAQWNELLNSNFTALSIATEQGVTGISITSNSNGNSIFLPLPGVKFENTVEDDGTWTVYMSMDLTNVYQNGNGDYFRFFGTSLSIEDSEVHAYSSGWYDRYSGYPIRPVIGDRSLQLSYVD